jgi:hypothetical protein
VSIANHQKTKGLCYRKKGLCFFHGDLSKFITCCTRVLHVKGQYLILVPHAHARLHQKASKSLHAALEDVRGYNYIGSPAALTCLSMASALLQLRFVLRLLVVRIAPALLRLCRAFGRAVSPLDFSSVGRIGSRRASGHCVSRRDYSSSGLHWFYCAYAVHPDASSRRSTSRRSAALALVVRPVTASRGATTCHPDCTGSTAPMPCIRTRHLAGRLSRRLATLALAVRPVTTSRGATTRRPDCTASTAPVSCIRTRRLDARLLVSHSHWLSPCARSFCCAS